MASRLRRVLRRTAVSATVMALPLAAAGTAQAAIAGASPGTTNDRPDLISAHITSATSPNVQACFDKKVDAAVGPGSAFTLVGYRAGNGSAATSAPTVDSSNSKCVDLTFANGADINNFTTLHVAAGAVTYTGIQNAETPTGNLADSTTLVESTSRSGITGKITGPDLTGVMPGTASDTLVFVFDKYVVPHATGGNLAIVDQQDNFCVDTAESNPSSGGNTAYNEIVATFNDCNSQQFGSSNVNVTNAVEGLTLVPGDRTYDYVTNSYLNATGVYAAYDYFNGYDGNGSFASHQTAPIPGGQSLQSTTPVLTSASETSPSTDTITYTFNQAVTNAYAPDFHATLSNGYEISGTAETTSGSTVTVSFGGALKAQHEFGVEAFVYDFAVQSQSNANNGQQHNLPMSTPVGDNSGGFARGFTTAPDVFGVQYSSGSGDATVFLDQRTLTVNTGAMYAYGGLHTGSGVPANSGSQVVSGGTNPGPEAVKVNFPASSYSAIQFLGNSSCAGGSSGTGEAFDSTLQSGYDANSTCDPANVDQVVAPTSTAAIAHAVKVNAARLKKVRHHKARRHFSRHFREFKHR